mmetsp:Transcript_51931/g.151300  ORF Transcript_51931/g.151300 Transcript_51931/m.151300 type:complete len:437 (+) Transcript_51931:85-1395(+)
MVLASWVMPSQPQEPDLEDVSPQADDASATSDSDADTTEDSATTDSEAQVVEPAQKKKSEPGRLYVLDNAKFILIVCVVLTHFLAPLAGDKLFSRCFEGARFAFMMPTFTFISGYCSSTELKTAHKVDANMKVFVIYTLAQAFWLVVARYRWGGVWDTMCFGKILHGNAWFFVKDRENGMQIWDLEDFSKPYFHLWYLWCLCWWRICLPYWWRLRYPLITVWIFAAAFSAYDMYRADPFQTWMPDVQYVVSWYPLFCLGTKAKEMKWELWHHPHAHLIGAMVIFAIAWLPIMFYMPGPYNNGVIWAYGTSLENIFGPGMWGNTLLFGCRLLVPLAHAVCIWGFLHVVPWDSTPLITRGGERCLSCYIFHPIGGCLLSLIGAYGPGPDCNASHAPWWSESVVIAFSIMSALFWTAGPVWKFLSPICDPPVHLLFRKG